MADVQQEFFARHRSNDGKHVIELGGECDAASLEELNELLRAVVSERARDVVVDLEEATFVDSLTLGSLTAAAKQMRAAGGTFQVTGAGAPDVRRVFVIKGLDRY